MRSRRETAAIRGILIVLALAVLGAGIAAYFIFIHPELMYKRQTVAKMPFDSSDVYAPHNGGAVFLKQGKLSFASREGRVDWTQDSLPGGKLVTSSGMIAVYTENKVTAYAGDTGEPRFNKTFTGQQVDLVRGCASHVAISLKGMDGSPMVELYASTGGKIDEIAFAGQTIIDMGFFSTSSTSASLWVMSIKQGSPQVDTRILTYNPQKGSISTSVTVPGQLSYRVVFGEKSLYAVGTNHLLGYNYNSDMVFKTVVYGWRLLDTQAQGLPMVFTPSAPSGSIGQAMKIITAPDKEENVALPAGTLGVYVGDKRIFVITGKQIKTYDFAGKHKRDYPLQTELSIKSVQCAPDKKTFLAVSGEEVYIFSLP